MGHNVGDAAARSVEKSKEKKAHQERTPAQVIKDIRNHLDAKLAIVPDDVRVLLNEYDKMSVSEKSQSELEPINGD